MPKWNSSNVFLSVSIINVLINVPVSVALRHACSPVNLLRNFKTPFLKNTSGWLLLHLIQISNRKNNSIVD